MKQEMQAQPFSRFALAISATWLLAGCGGSQPPIGAPGVMTQTSAVAHHASRGKSWMLPEVKGEDLIYAAGDGHSYVLTYPQGKLVENIDEGGVDVCSDSSGDVYLAVGAPRIDEFTHGATKPSTSFSLPGVALGCSVDPTTGSLAVTFLRTKGNNVAVFPPGDETPTLFSSSLNVAACGYDDHDNLFVAGTTPTDAYTLDELPANGKSFTTLSITPAIQRVFGRVQWDGSYLTVQSSTYTKKPRSVFISRLSISGSVATVVGTTPIKGIKQTAFPSWIENSRVLVPYGNASKGTPDIGYWRYASGGPPTRTLKVPAGKADLNALTISI
jgi:hypothetical protein